MNAPDTPQPGDREQPPPTDPASDRVSESVRIHPLVRVFLWAALVALTLYFWSTITFVFMILLAAGCIAAMLGPLNSRAPGPRWLSGTTVSIAFFLIFIGVRALAGYLMYQPLVDQIHQWPRTRATINEHLHNWTEELGFMEPLTIDDIRRQVVGALTGDGGAEMGSILTSLGALAVGSAAFVFGSIYLIAEQPQPITSQLRRLMPYSDGVIDRGLGKLSPRLRWWLIGTLVSMTVSGIFQGLGSWIVGLKFALAMGVLAGVAQVVPTFGPLSMFILALLIAATQGVAQIIGVAVVYVLVQLLESYILLPLIMQKAVNIPPLITLISIVLWGRLLGPLGLILALPINLFIWTCIEVFYIERKEAASVPANANPPPPRPE